MNKNSTPRKGIARLYDPQQEGICGYDMHYINAYQKATESKKALDHTKNERQAA